MSEPFDDLMNEGEFAARVAKGVQQLIKEANIDVPRDTTPTPHPDDEDGGVGGEEEEAWPL